MTATALKNKEIESKEKIADQDRNLKRKEFEHKKKMDIVNAITGGAGTVAKLFIPGGKAKLAGQAVKGLVQAAKHNGPEWYKNYLTDLDKYTNLTTFTRLGFDNVNHHFISTITYNGSTVIKTASKLPGIAVLHYISTLGPKPTSNSMSAVAETPINQILMRTKEQVLKSNSRSNVPYEAADLGLNMLASGHIILAICELERVLYVAQTYRADNAYYAKAYLTALGWNPDAILNKLADLRTQLMVLKKRFNSSVVAPKEISFYKKLLYLGTMWIKDSQAKPNQIYTAVADSFWRLSDDGSSLNAISPNRISLSTYIDQVNSMIQKITENPDYIAMYADLRSAFSDAIFQFDESVDALNGIEETYDSYAIEQIANIDTLPIIYDDDSVTAPLENLTVRQTSTGFLYQGPVGQYGTGITATYSVSDFMEGGVTESIPVKELFKRDYILNMHKDDINGDDILDATRWKIVYGDVVYDTKDDKSNLVINIASSDVTLGVYWSIYYYDNSGTLKYYNVSSMVMYAQSDANARNEVIHSTTLASVFDWMPPTEEIYCYVSGTTWNVVSHTRCEFQHTVNVNSDNLTKLHNACVLSEFYINTSSFKR